MNNCRRWSPNEDATDYTAIIGGGGERGAAEKYMVM